MGDAADDLTDSMMASFEEEALYLDEEPTEPVAPQCPYCGSIAELKDSAIIYHGKSYGPVWLCPNWPQCDSYVGCHKGTHNPLGRMANKELRKAKIAAHAAFDKLWQGRSRSARRRAYGDLARRMGIPKEKAHIGQMNIQQCERVVEICEMLTRNGVQR